MRHKIIYIFVALTIFVSQGCKKEDTTSDKNMDNMVAPAGFTFETSREIPISITMPESINFDELRSRFDVFTSNPNEGGKLIFSGSFDKNGLYNGTIRIPSTVSEITVSTIAGMMTVSVQPVNFAKDGEVSLNFGNNYGSNPPDSLTANKSLINNNLLSSNIVGNKSNRTLTNLVSNGDFETDDFGHIYYWNSVMPFNDKWYLTTRYDDTERYDDAGNWVVRTPYANGHYAGGVVQTIDATPGDVFTYSADIKSTIQDNNNRFKFWLFLIPVDASGHDIQYFEYGIVTPTTTWTNVQMVATMPQGTVTCEVLLWAHDLLANQSIMFDNVVVTKQVTDTDGDGVDDDEDDYPLDPTRAFNVYYPNETDWGTFAYEDLWPGKGDYDFNDLVVDYQFKSVLNAHNELVEFFTDYSVRAIGASLTNGFAFMIPGDPANVASITGTNITENYLSLNANGTEQNQTNTVIFLFDNAFTMIGSSGSSFVNTKEDVDYVEPDTNQLYVSYTNAVNNPGQAPYNPFIVVDKTRGIEVHLAGQAPTQLADFALFGTWADDSDPATGKYYQTVNNLPWALDLPVKFDYPIEQVQIIDAYNYFQSWGESGGTTYTDWYEDNAGYRNESNVYAPPE